MKMLGQIDIPVYEDFTKINRIIEAKYSDFVGSVSARLHDTRVIAVSLRIKEALNENS